MGISEIHDFRGKCDLVNGISRKIFVAVNGYQSGAKGAAEKFNIDLYDLSEISTQLLSEWVITNEIRLSYPSETRIGPISFFTKDGRELIYRKEMINRDFCLYEVNKRPIQLYFMVSEVLANSMKQLEIVDFIKNHIEEEWDKIKLIEFENEVVITVSSQFNFSGRRFGAILEDRMQELEKIGVAIEYVYGIDKPGDVIARAYRRENTVIAETVSGTGSKFKFELIRNVSNGLTKIYAFDSLGRVIEFK